MCGIVGAVSTRAGAPMSEDRLRAMREAIAHRGPDDDGFLLSDGVALGSRRLAILDLSPRGHMPMSTPDGRYTIVYNGEVYNFQDLRASLEARGMQFRTHTDTEVLLALYAQDGPSMLDRLNGMFAFAIWDAEQRSLFVCRDRLGVKPLHYAITDDTLFFASEEKALFAAGVQAEFNPEVWHELLRFNYIAGTRTPFRGVQRLLPGHYFTWRQGRLDVRRWWNLSERIQSASARPQAPEQWFGETFDDSVRLRRISDVPVGVLLSGGLDSSSVAASLAAQAGEGVSSFTIRFADDPHYDEGPLARLVAERWHLDHHELTVQPTDLLERLKRAAWFNDEPLAHYSDLHLGAISEYAKSRVTVLLSGEGSDETLGGYVRYWPLRYPSVLAAARVFAPLLGATGSPRLRKLQQMLALGETSRLVLFNASSVFPEDLAVIGVPPAGPDAFAFREQMVAEAQRAYPGQPARQAMYSDVHTFLCSLLDRNDRMTMGASIECRVPFLDYRLVEGLSALPSSELLRGRRGKRLLLASRGDRLPEGIRAAAKRGFSVPWRRYLREQPELRARVEAIPESPIIASGPFDQRLLRDAIRRFLAGQSSLDLVIISLFMITTWYDSYFGRLNGSGKPARSEMVAGR